MFQRLGDQRRFKRAIQAVKNVFLAAPQRGRDFAFQRPLPVAVERCRAAFAAAWPAHIGWQVRHFHHLRRRHDGDPVAQVFELPHIAREILLREEIQRILGESFGIDVQIARAFCQEVPGQQRNIVAPVAQRRQAQADHVEPVIQVFPEQALLDAQIEVLMGGGNYPHIGGDGGMAADAIELPVGQHAQ